MGAVYRAEQSRLGRTVAVKILPSTGDAPDGDAQSRFEREARILSGLNHPHILQIYDFGALPDGTLYLVTEWAGGGDLSKLMDGRQHSPAEVVPWVRQIAAALDAAHARGIVHRDLKPANVLVLDDGRLTLADFGLAHVGGCGFTTAITTPGAIFGTFEYMAPEQMESAEKVSPATDIYALGVMTYQMLTGRVPRGAFARASRLSRVPSEVDAVLDRAMANDPLRRPRSAAEFVHLLDRAIRSPDRRRQRQLVVLGVALVALTLAWARAAIIKSEREAAANEARAVETAVQARLAEARRAALQEAAQVVETPPEAAPANPDPATLVSAQPSPAETAPAPAEVVSVPEPVETATVPPAPAPGNGETKEPEAKPELPSVPWTWLLPELKPASAALSGEWRMVRGELVSGEGRCTLSLPVRLAVNYDIAVEFTRNGGKNSVAIFLPTLVGIGSLEIDAWDLGIAGLQTIDGLDMRRTNRFFAARIENGQKHRVIVEVRGQRVSVTWDGDPKLTWDLSGRRFRLPLLWQLTPEIGLGLGSWNSPTTFHRVAYRAYPADLDAASDLPPTAPSGPGAGGQDMPKMFPPGARPPGGAGSFPRPPVSDR
jgi:hypothetical protein